MNLSPDEKKNLKNLQQSYAAVLEAIVRSLEIIANGRAVVGETHEKTIENVYKTEGYKECLADIKHYFHYDP